MMDEQALLRRFEPVVRYTRGEQFFPMAVESYVRESSLWVQHPNQEPQCVIPEGSLTLENLVEPRCAGFDAVYFLKFIEPLNIAQLASYSFKKVREDWLGDANQDHFRAGMGRLARVGYLSRFMDALFSLTLFARGRVPGDTAAAAAIAYRKLLDEGVPYHYYGRVVRQGSWVVLQYWFFYAFNNWRSGFFGVNDHEGDWEMVSFYLWEDAAGELHPEWVAYASHDFYGDDLRRRWDDPEVEKVGEHPIIYAGAGSHASYYAAGEYLAEVDMPFMKPVGILADQARLQWRKWLRQRAFGDSVTLDVFRVPFVDYARGDGMAIGPGQAHEWTSLTLLDPLPEWALAYRGLWGLYAQDPISGENAPAGPLYNRDGTIRRSWYDPVGWAGLDKVPTPGEALPQVYASLAQTRQRQVITAAQIADKRAGLLALGVEVQALLDQPHLKALYEARREAIAALSVELDTLHAQLAGDAVLIEALELQAQRLECGARGPARAHIHRTAHSATEAELRLGRLAEAWAALSIGVMLVGIVVLFLFARHYITWGLAALFTLFAIVEAGFRNRLQNAIAGMTLALACLAALILLYEFFWEILVLGVLIAGGYIIWENLRELWGGL